MNAVKLSQDQEAAIVSSILENKPYLLAVEDAVQKIEFGEMEVVLHVRGKVVEKMEFVNKKNWFKSHSSNKDIDLIQKTGSI